MKNPQLPIYFQPFRGAPNNSIYNDRLGAHLVDIGDKSRPSSMNFELPISLKWWIRSAGWHSNRECSWAQFLHDFTSWLNQLVLLFCVCFFGKFWINTLITVG